MNEIQQKAAELGINIRQDISPTNKSFAMANQ
jgi:hypothetical protein